MQDCQGFYSFSDLYFSSQTQVETDSLFAMKLQKKSPAYLDSVYWRPQKLHVQGGINKAAMAWSRMEASGGVAGNGTTSHFLFTLPLILIIILKANDCL